MQDYKRITISFTAADNDIVSFLSELRASSKASQFVREAIREKMGEKSLDNAVQDLIKRVNILESGRLGGTFPEFEKIDEEMSGMAQELQGAVDFY